MKPTNRLVRSALLIVAPVVLAAKIARAVSSRTASALRGSGSEPAVPTPASVPDRALAAVPARGGTPAPEFRRAATAAAEDLEEPSIYSSELPIPAYDALNGKDASTAIKALDDVEHVRVMLHYEEENAKRTAVHRAARLRLQALER